MIHLEYVDRAHSVQTADGVVQSARKPRCIACNNCVLACPFGVPKMQTEFQLMMKCDMCYDRISAGKKPMCATVCPSGALFFGAREEVERLRPRSQPVNQFQFGQQTITTKVNLMTPKVARAATVRLSWKPDGRWPGPRAVRSRASSSKSSTTRSTPPASRSAWSET